jgi:endonuclease/exonuclease/phosphatase family metal-dependent hydrolase
MGPTIYVGVAVSSHVSGNLATATFASTVVTRATVQSTNPGSTLRVMEWNTHHGGIGTDGVYNPSRIATWIAAAKPDLVALSEVDEQYHVDGIVNALKAKTGATWYASFSGHGNLALSRLPLTTKSNCLYDSSLDAYSAHVSVVVNGRTINLWSTQLHVSSASARLSEARALQGCARNWTEARIIAGDYNMQYGSTEYAAATQGYSDAWVAARALGATTNYPGNCDGCTRNSRIDYVFASTGAAALTMKSAQVIDTRDGNGVMPSDHKPMLVVYNVK